MVKTPWRVCHQGEDGDPEAEGDVVDGLQRHDLGYDHPGIPDGVAELIAHTVYLTVTELSFRLFHFLKDLLVRYLIFI